MRAACAVCFAVLRVCCAVLCCAVLCCAAVCVLHARGVPPPRLEHRHARSLNGERTGSGKTHTMSGTEEEGVADEGSYSGGGGGGGDGDGIITRAVQYLFHAAHTRTDAKCARALLLGCCCCATPRFLLCCHDTRHTHASPPPATPPTLKTTTATHKGTRSRRRTSRSTTRPCSTSSTSTQRPRAAACPSSGTPRTAFTSPASRSCRAARCAR